MSNNKIIDAGEIGEIISTLCEKIHQRAVWPLHVHVIMNGGFMFATDFLREYRHSKIEEVSFPLIRRGYSTGRVHPPQALKSTLPTINMKKLRSHVLLDVIVEEGKTMKHYIEHFPRILRPLLIPVALIQKGSADLPKEWLIGKRLDDVGFLYGYGMGPWRDWGAIYVIDNGTET